MWITRAGGAGDTDIEAEKGALSDAFKRAAVLFGIGRYLYDLPNEWIEIDEYKKFKRKPSLPAWALPKDAVPSPKESGKSIPKDVWDKLQIEEQDFLREIANHVIAALSHDDLVEANRLFYLNNLDQDQQTGMWYLFDSKQRSTIKKYKDSLK